MPLFHYICIYETNVTDMVKKRGLWRRDVKERDKLETLGID
jgi:hypothetical protein